MAKYVCSICGYVHDEAENGPFEQLEKCPLCKQPASVFVKKEEEPVQEPVPQPVVQQQSKAAPRHLEDFSIDDLLHFGETSDEEVQA